MLSKEEWLRIMIRACRKNLKAMVEIEEHLNERIARGKQEWDSVQNEMVQWHNAELMNEFSDQQARALSGLASQIADDSNALILHLENKAIVEKRLEMLNDEWDKSLKGTIVD